MAATTTQGQATTSKSFLDTLLRGIGDAAEWVTDLPNRLDDAADKLRDSMIGATAGQQDPFAGARENLRQGKVEDIGGDIFVFLTSPLGVLLIIAAVLFWKK